MDEQTIMTVMADYWGHSRVEFMLPGLSKDIHVLNDIVLFPMVATSLD